MDKFENDHDFKKMFPENYSIYELIENISKIDEKIKNKYQEKIHIKYI